MKMKRTALWWEAFLWSSAGNATFLDLTVLPLFVSGIALLDHSISVARLVDIWTILAGFLTIILIAFCWLDTRDDWNNALDEMSRTEFLQMRVRGGQWECLHLNVIGLVLLACGWACCKMRKWEWVEDLIFWESRMCPEDKTPLPRLEDS